MKIKRGMEGNLIGWPDRGFLIIGRAARQGRQVTLPVNGKVWPGFR